MSVRSRRRSSRSLRITVWACMAIAVAAPALADDDAPAPAGVNTELRDLIKDGRLDEAAAAARRQLDAKPDEVAPAIDLAYIEVLRQHEDAALELLNKTVAAHPGDGTALYYRGSLLAKRGAMADAVRDLTAARDALIKARNPMAWEAKRWLAYALRSGGDPLAAVKELEEILKAIPGDRRVRYELMSTYATLPQPRWAVIERLIREAKAQPGGDRDPAWPRAEAAMWVTRGQPAKAVAAARSALDLAREGGGDADLGWRLEDAARYYLFVLQQAKQYDALLAEADKFQAEGEFKDADWVLVSRAVALAGQGKRDEALTAFDGALESIARQKKGNRESVIQAIADAVGVPEAIERSRKFATGDDDAAALVTEAALYVSQRDYDHARPPIERALKVQGMDPALRQYALGIAGSIYMVVPDYRKAEAAYRELLKLAPDDMVSLNNLAWLYEECLDPPEPKKALEVARHAMEVSNRLQRTDAALLDTYGWALFLNGLTEEAIEQLQRSIKTNDTGDAHVHLAAALLATPGHEVEARDELDRAKTLFDADRAAKRPVEPKSEARLKAMVAKLDAAGK